MTADDDVNYSNEEDGVSRSNKPEWEQTTDGSEEPAEEEIILSSTPEPSGQIPADSSVNDSSHTFNEESGARKFVSNVITLRMKPGHPPTPEQLAKALQQAMEQGWETLYVFKGDGKTPDLQMAQYIQQFIEQNGASDRINCCVDPNVYAACGCVDDIKRENEQQGAISKPNVSIP